MTLGFAVTMSFYLFSSLLTYSFICFVFTLRLWTLVRFTGSIIVCILVALLYNIEVGIHGNLLIIISSFVACKA